jgi:hypothetical protein
MDDYKKIVKQVYEFYSIVVSKDKKFKFKQNWNEKVLLDNFEAILTEQFGDKLSIPFIYDYFNFQYNYWEDKIITKNKIKGIYDLSWIIGPKSYERWEKKGPNWKYFVVQNFIKKHHLEINLLYLHLGIDNPRLNTQYKNVFKCEERDRAMYLNQNIGLGHCVSFTSLYHPKSESCPNCENKIRCQKLLFHNFPLIYKERGVTNDKL